MPNLVNERIARKRLLIAVLMFVCLDILIGSYILPRTNRQWYRQQQEREYANRFRIAHPYYHHGLAPNVESQAEWFDRTYMMYTNSIGLRDRSIRTVQRLTQAHRVLFLGDSAVEGMGYDYDKTFIGILDHATHDETYEFLNGGVVSHSPKLYTLHAQYLLEQQEIEIDEIVIFIDMSDIKDETAYENFVPEDSEERTGMTTPTHTVGERIYGFFADHSILVNIFADRAPGRNHRFFQDVETWTTDEAVFDAWGRHGVELAQKHMGELIRIAREHDVETITIVVSPWPHQIRSKDYPSMQHTIWEEFANKQEIGFISLFDDFMGEDTIEEYFIPGDVHWNDRGHARVADALIQHLSIRTGQ